MLPRIAEGSHRQPVSPPKAGSPIVIAMNLSSASATPTSHSMPEAGQTRLGVFRVMVSASLALGLLWARTDHLTPDHPWWSFPGDHHIYLLMADRPVGDLHLAPWGWRILGPWLAHVFPGSHQVGFQLVCWMSLVLAATFVYRICLRLGFDVRLAFCGLLLFVSVSFATKYVMFDFWLTDPLAFAFISLAVLLAVEQRLVAFAICLAFGVLVKESVLFAAPLLYTFGAQRPLDRRALWRATVATAPALMVLLAVRIAIPAWNGQQYAQSLPSLIAANARTVPDYSALAVAREVVTRRMADLPATLVRAVSAFGLLVGVLPLLGGRCARPLAVRFAPFLVLVALQLVFAYNTQRLLVLAFPAVIPLALCGLRSLRERGVPNVALLGTCGVFAGLQLLSPDEVAPSPILQAAVLALCAAWMWASARRVPRPAVAVPA